MAELRFKLGFQSEGMRDLAVPLEIRRADSTLVKRMLSTESTNLDAGSYFVEARLPAGQVLSKTLTIGPDAETVELDPDPADASPSEDVETFHFMRQASSPWMQRTDEEAAAEGILSRARRFVGFGRQPRREELRVFRGDPLSGYLEVAASADLLFRTGLIGQTVQYRIDPTPAMETLQLTIPGARPLNARIPVSPEEGATVVVDLETHQLSFQLAHVQANALLHFLQSGDLQGVSATLDSPRLQATELLRGKVRHPIAATVGAYALLRMGEAEARGSWIENLAELFPWLPDGAVILGELRARMGEHELAQEALAMGLHRGLPIFTQGLDYLLDRADFYESTLDRPLADEERMTRLRILGMRADRWQPVVSWGAWHPARPDDITAPFRLPGPPGLEVR